MRDWGKKLLGLAAIGGAIAGIIYYLKKNEKTEDDDFDMDFEDEDFDLDEDLKPVTDREYVSLTPAAEADAETDEAPETVEDKAVTDETSESVEDEVKADEK